MLHLTVAGDSWQAAVAAKLLALQGFKVTLCHFQKLPTPHYATCYVGMGSHSAYTKRVMGEDLGSLMWDLSLKNFEKAKLFFQALSHKTQTLRVLSHSMSPIDSQLEQDSLQDHPEIYCWGDVEGTRVLEQEGLVWDPHEVETQIIESFSKNHLYHTSSDPLWVKRNGLGDLEIKLEDQTLSSSLLLVLAEGHLPQWFEFLSDKLIALTMSCFEYQASPSPLEPGQLHLFHQGADLFYQASSSLKLSSFRALGADHAVGLSPKPDEISKTGLETFFGKKKWLTPQNAFKGFENHYLSTSCDGRLIVSPLPGMTEVLVMAGFMGRASHLLFELVDLLGPVLKGGPQKALLPFSLSRFNET